MKVSLFRKKTLVEHRENIQTKIKGHLINVKNIVYNNLAERIINHSDYIMIATITYYLTRFIFS